VGHRIALVIGNAEYQHAPMLANPTNDAASVAEAFRQLDFKIYLHRNLGLMELRRALADFSEAAEGAEMAVVYFAGHGVEIGGINYLLPIDAQAETVGRVRWETMPLDELLSVVAGAKQLQLIILDACRDNPFAGRMRGLEATRSLARGLGVIEPQGNKVVVYAAKHGTKAKDGPLGGNSPFAEALLQHLATPGLDIRFLFGRVRDAVLGKTNNSQEPYVYAALGGEPIYLNASPVDAEEAVRTLRENRLLEGKDIALIQAWLRTYGAKAPEFDRELVRRHHDRLIESEAADWTEARKRDDAEAYRKFLADWPTGPHADEAKGRLTALQKKKEAPDAWAAVCQSDNLAELDGFLARYGDSEHAPAARARRQEVAHRVEWQEVLSRSDDIKRLEDFVAGPPGPFTAAVQARLEALREAVAKRGTDQRRPVSPVPPPPPPTASMREPTPTELSPTRTRTRLLPVTMAIAGLAGAILQSALWGPQSVFAGTSLASMLAGTLLLATALALAAWLHERSFRLAGWVFGIVACGYLVGQPIYVAIKETILSSLRSAGYPTYNMAVVTTYMTASVLPLLALAAWRFRALPPVWMIALLVVAGLLVGLAVRILFQIPAVPNYLIPWTLWAACVGAILARRKA